jgi:hypothetical protein
MQIHFKKFATLDFGTASVTRIITVLIALELGLSAENFVKFSTKHRVTVRWRNRKAEH